MGTKIRAGGNSMNKADLISAVAQESGLTKKDSEAAIDALVSVVTETLTNDEKVVLVGFGTFETKNRAERKGRNPQTKQAITIPASKAPVFKAGKALKDRVNG
jgi:DNA-binding protein HU-beta